MLVALYRHPVAPALAPLGLGALEGLVREQLVEPLIVLELVVD